MTIRFSAARTAALGRTLSRRTDRAAGWIGDFAWRDGRIVIRKTGIALVPDRRVLSEILSWAAYLPLLAAAATVARLRQPAGLSIWYAPETPRPWYLMRGVALWSGFGLASSEGEADAAFYFDDVTRGQAPPSTVGRQFNFRCTDVSKSRVARTFEAVFGYPLSVDPTCAEGEIVEKSETNGVHDGRVVIAPLRPQPGRVYQRLVDTCNELGLGQDLRTPCVGGVPVVVWVKSKPAGQRFGINNTTAVLKDPAEVYSADEMASIRRFNAAMGLDWGGLDILRDRHSGRLYIVDVNKTDLGPVIALSWADKVRSMNRLARALRHMLQEGGNPVSIIDPRSKELAHG